MLICELDTSAQNSTSSQEKAASTIFFRRSQEKEKDLQIEGALEGSLPSMNFRRRSQKRAYTNQMSAENFGVDKAPMNREEHHVRQQREPALGASRGRASTLEVALSIGGEQSCETSEEEGEGCSEERAELYPEGEEQHHQHLTNSDSGFENQEALTKKRKMNIIYSRRKREKKKMQVEALNDHCLELRQDNDNLAREGRKLERLLDEAKLLVSQIESFSATAGRRDDPAILTPLMFPSVYNAGVFSSPLTASRLRIPGTVPTGRTTTGVPASEIPAFLSHLQSAPSYAPMPVGIAAFNGVAATKNPSLARAGNPFVDHILAQQLAIQHQQKRYALLEYAIQQGSLEQGENLCHKRFPQSHGIAVNLPGVVRSLPSSARRAANSEASSVSHTKDSSVVVQQPRQEDPVSFLLLKQLLAQAQQNKSAATFLPRDSKEGHRP